MGIKVDELVPDAPAAAKPKGKGVSVVGLQPDTPKDDKDNFDATKMFEDEPVLSAGMQVGTRFAKGVGEIPGIPMDLLQLAGQIMPEWATPMVGPMAPVLRSEQARQKKEGKDSPIMLGTENFSRMEQDWLGLPKPAAPKNEVEKVLGNVSEFAGSSMGPGGLTRDALKAAVGGGTLLTGAQDLFPDSPMAQLTAAILGGHAPRAMAAAPGKIKAALAPTLRGTTKPGREAIVGETLNRQVPPPFKPSFDPKAIAATGVKPTLAQASGDEKLLALQEHAAGKDPKLAADLARREAENKTAARTSLEGIRGDGTPAAATEHAAAQLAETERAAAAEKATIRTEKDQATLSDTARGWIEKTHGDTLAQEKVLWDRFRGLGRQVEVPVGPLRERLNNWINQQDIKPAMPPEIERALAQFETDGKGSVNVVQIQALRPELRELRQTAEAAGDMRTARVYSGLEKTVGKYLDAITFKDSALQASLKEARDFTRERAATFKLPREMRRVLGSDTMGGERVASGSTLKQFVKTGPEGRDAIRTLLDADPPPEIRRTVADYVAAGMPEDATGARKWIKSHEPMLRELGSDGPVSWYDRFSGIVDRQAAVEALRDSPLGLLNKLTPEKAVQKIMKDTVDPLRAAKELRSQMASNPAAWSGMQRAFADEIINNITDITKRDLNDRGTISPGDLTRLTHEQGALARIFLGDKGVKTLEAIDKALQQVNRRAAGGLADPKNALPSITGQRFLDKIVEKLANDKHGGAEAALGGATAGYAVAGFPIGTAAGAGAGYGAHLMAHAAQEPLQELFRSALMNPEIGNALMHTASVKSMPAVPKALRPFLKDFLGAERGAVATTTSGQAQPKPEKPKQKVSMAEPSRSMPDGMGFIRQPDDQSAWTGQGGPGGGRGHPIGKELNARKAAAGKPIDPTPEAVFNGYAGPKPGVNPDGTTYDTKLLPRSGEGTRGHDDKLALLDLLKPDKGRPAPVPPKEPARLPSHEVSAEAFAQMTPEAQQHLMQALMTPSGLDLSDIEQRRQKNVAGEMDARKGFPNIKGTLERQNEIAEEKAQNAEARSTGVGSGPGALNRRVTLPTGEDFAMLLKIINEANQRRLAAIAKNPGKLHPGGLGTRQ